MKSELQNITFRDYQKNDFSEINTLWESTGVGGSHRGDDEEVIEETIRNGGKLIVAESGQGEIIGTSWLTSDGRRIYLHHFCIRDDYRKKGVGELLCENSIDFAKQKNKQLKLEVHQDNKAAIRLYRKMGFDFLGDYDVYIIRKF